MKENAVREGKKREVEYCKRKVKKKAVGEGKLMKRKGKIVEKGKGKDCLRKGRARKGRC